MGTLLEGGCNCRAIRYRMSEMPMTVLACHCENCRRQSGAAFSINLVMKADAVEITGTCKTYEDTDTESGNPVYRDFCGDCGSPIRSRAKTSASIAVIKAGTLDNPSPFEPALHIWTCTKLDWVTIPQDAQQVERNLPA